MTGCGVRGDILGDVEALGTISRLQKGWQIDFMSHANSKGLMMASQSAVSSTGSQA